MRTVALTKESTKRYSGKSPETKPKQLWQNLKQQLTKF